MSRILFPFLCFCRSFALNASSRGPFKSKILPLKQSARSHRNKTELNGPFQFLPKIDGGLLLGDQQHTKQDPSNIGSFWRLCPQNIIKPISPKSFALRSFGGSGKEEKQCVCVCFPRGCWKKTHKKQRTSRHNLKNRHEIRFSAKEVKHQTLSETFGERIANHQIQVTFFGVLHALAS